MSLLQPSARPTEPPENQWSKAIVEALEATPGTYDIKGKTNVKEWVARYAAQKLNKQLNLEKDRGRDVSRLTAWYSQDVEIHEVPHHQTGDPVKIPGEKLDTYTAHIKVSPTKNTTEQGNHERSTDEAKSESSVGAT